MTNIVELRAGIKVWLDGCSWEVVALQPWCLTGTGWARKPTGSSVR
ncbi:hypothetical protein [Rhodococcoides yunnanense]|nr:hypothetical protein [Rhodococcus yunnanensis]MCZ4278784.1 hypothetical protein [Rhodococcus yunnanensis]